MTDDRLARLERNCRILQRTTIVLALAVIYLTIGCKQGSTERFAVGAPNASTNPTFTSVTAHSLQIVDDSGRVRATLGTMDDDSTIFKLSDGKSAQISATVMGEVGQLFVFGPRYECAIGEGFAMDRRDPTIDREVSSCYEHLKKLTNSDDEKAIRERIAKLVAKKRQVEIFSYEAGGAVRIFNALGAAVVEAQSNKGNQGAVYVNDVNGETQNFLTVNGVKKQ